MEIPLFEEITLEYIIERLIRDFKVNGLNKTIIGQEIFGGYKNLQRIQTGHKKLTSIDCDLLFNKIKVLYGDNSKSFIATIISWFPSLSVYRTEEELVTVLKANLLGTASSNITPYHHHEGNKHFLQFYLENPAFIKRIRLATQTGYGWFDDPEMVALFYKLAEHRIEVLVLGNSESLIMKKILSTMQSHDPHAISITLNKLLTKWHDYELSYQNISLRVSDYPILHQTLMVEFNDNSMQTLLCDYTYGSSIENTSLYRWIPNTHPDHTYYKAEFDYLWNNAIPYQNWLDALPFPEEFLRPGNYVLLYQTHEMYESPSIKNPKWIYSILSITEDNSVSLKANVSDPYKAIGDCEYSYQGRLKLTRNNIFISLFDSEQQEAISISFARPLYDKERFLGIMTALSPAGQPVAFKCACIGYSLLSKLDYSLLTVLLTKHNHEWSDTLMVLENQDINLFNSDKILINKLI